VGHVAHIGDLRNEYKYLVKKINRMCEGGLDSSGLG
jgi:hypothetical protein